MRNLLLVLAVLVPSPQEDDPAGSERARQMFERFPSRGQLTDLSTPARAPEETVRSFTLADGLEAEAVLHEPVVRQPVFLNFDERGRMWVVQFIQYPYPAGLKVVDLDHQFHATYDKVPPPPPYPPGSPFRGKSLISIHEDSDGDGSFDRHKVFLDGLSMATAVEQGRGGVWVLQPPYLLFYPDRDRDDRPDGDPEVHLAGFGMEDTHSTANSLRWGPDGWLYGGHGSGCSATVVRPGIDEKGFYFKGQLMEALADARPAEAVPVLLGILGRSASLPARAAALSALAQFEDPAIATGVLSHWSGYDRDLRDRAAVVLCRRKTWARTLLDESVRQGAIPRQDISDEVVGRIRLLGDPELTALTDKYFGRPVKPTSEEKQKRIREVAAILGKEPGDGKAGRPLYAARCASCHKLFGEGGTVGPDLTGYERTNLENMILSVVDPSAAIREGFVQHLVATKDGRTLVGIIAERDGDRMVLVDSRGERTVVPSGQVEKQRMLEASMMAEGALDGLSEQQVRDLFAYLASKGP